MTDREKVVQNLEEVIADAVYPDRPRKFMMSLELAEDALALLKVQEQVEPKYVHIGDWARQHFECGACGTVIKRTDKYCYKCGRGVKWE